jgi:hypothetical protein
MARRGAYKPRPGFERVPGKARAYRDLSTGKVISRRQYLKKTEGLRSLEEKRDRLKRERFEKGIEQPGERYKEIVKDFKRRYGPGARVRGDSAEAKEFRDAFRRLKRGFNLTTKKGQLDKWETLYRLGIISKRKKQEYDKDTYEEFATDDEEFEEIEEVEHRLTIERRRKPGGTRGQHQYRAVCDECGWRTKWYATRKRAIKEAEQHGPVEDDE